MSYIILFILLSIILTWVLAQLPDNRPYNVHPFIIDNDWFNKDLPITLLMDFGQANGYVAIHKSHPLYGEHFDREWNDYIPGLDNRESLPSVNDIIDAHRGLTYANKLCNFQRSQIPDYLQDNANDYWVFGFDTFHASDTHDKWTQEKVREHTGCLAKQLSNPNLRKFRMGVFPLF